jgi:hypothetical protein
LFAPSILKSRAKVYRSLDESMQCPTVRAGDPDWQLSLQQIQLSNSTVNALARRALPDMAVIIYHVLNVLTTE